MHSGLSSSLERWITPHPSLQAEDARRQVKLFLAGCLIILFLALIGTAGAYFDGWATGALAGARVMGGIALLLAAAYGLGRSRRHLWGFLLATLTLIASPYVVVWLKAGGFRPGVFEQATVLDALAWMGPALLFAALLLPLRTLVGLAVLNLAAATATSAVYTGGSWLRSEAVGLAVVMGGLVVIGRIHAGRIERIHLQEIEAARVRLEQRVQERTELLVQANNELRTARQAAEEAFRNRSSYLAEVSHDLRTPLTIILGFSEMLNYQAQERGDAETSRHLTYIETSARYLVDLSKNLIDLARLERGETTIELETVWLPDLLEEVLLLARPLVAKNDNVLESDLDADLGEMHTDPTRLRQILINLLSNAGKFTEGGRIRLSAHRSPGADGSPWLTFEVSDTGIGLSAAQLKALFLPYPPSYRSTRERYSGSGLGLAITHMLCGYLGGSVEVRSQIEQGSTFTVRLPVKTTGPVNPTP